ncbi:MAG TPA: hypothetical protein VHO69_16235 [Phototrophicaceae bacterium]|nr:hypothetical protein [Phototrophicaceae bacterium]
MQGKTERQFVLFNFPMQAQNLVNRKRHVGIVGEVPLGFGILPRFNEMGQRMRRGEFKKAAQRIAHRQPFQRNPRAAQAFFGC